MLGAFAPRQGDTTGRRPGGTGNKAAPAAAAGKAAEDRSTAAPGSVDKALERVEEVVEQETRALQAGTAVDLKDFNDRKSQGLLELTRAMRQISATPDAALLARFARLRAKLEINRAALKLHLDAVREISTVVADAMRSADSDGTYSPAIRGAL